MVLVLVLVLFEGRLLYPSEGWCLLLGFSGIVSVALSLVSQLWVCRWGSGFFLVGLGSCLIPYEVLPSR